MTASPSSASRETGTDLLLVEVMAAVAVVTFNNPAKRNALSREIRAALPGTLAALQSDPEIRVVVVTGAGDKAFASGADISEFGEQRTTPPRAPRMTASRRRWRARGAASASPPSR